MIVVVVVVIMVQADRIAHVVFVDIVGKMHARLRQGEVAIEQLGCPIPLTEHVRSHLQGDYKGKENPPQTV